MRQCENCMQFKLPEYFYKCSARKDGLQGYCKSCCAVQRREWDRENPDTVRRVSKARKLDPRYRASHRKASAKYRTKNLQATRDRIEDWRKRNLGARAAYTRKRHAIKMGAVPKWANQFFIMEIYDLARLRTKVMGFKWHVDHIVPLKHPLVCGLHTEHNLRVIPAIDNMRKNNRYWPDMPMGN